MDAELPRARDVHVGHPTCPFCKAEVSPSDAKASCDACMAWQHSGCWTEHGRCAACGHVTADRPARTPHSPPRPAHLCKARNCDGTALKSTSFLEDGRCRFHAGGLVVVLLIAAGACLVPFLDLPQIRGNSWRGDESQYVSACAVALYVIVAARLLLRVGLAEERRAPVKRPTA